MPSNHAGHATIAFRPSPWQRCIIEQRAALSGHYKKDFIARACCYANIVIIGNRDNIQRVVDTAHEFKISMTQIVRQLQTDDLCLGKDEYEEFKRDILAFSVTLVDILDGAAYLFDTVPPSERRNWKIELELKQFKDSLNIK